MKLAQDSLEQLHKDLRDRERLSIKAICRRYGISQATVKRIRQRMKEPDIKRSAPGYVKRSATG